jgi:hypothetical protein
MEILHAKWTIQRGRLRGAAMLLYDAAEAERGHQITALPLQRVV